MNSHDTALAIAHALVAHEDLAAVHVYAHDTEVLPGGETVTHPEIQLPGVFIQVRFEALAGSGAIGRGKVEIDVESQSDEDSAATHSLREAAARLQMADTDALAAAFQRVGTVKLLGRPSLIENDPDVEARAFKTPLTYRIGVQAL